MLDYFYNSKTENAKKSYKQLTVKLNTVDKIHCYNFDKAAGK